MTTGKFDDDLTDSYDNNDDFSRGVEVRRAVLGDEHVGRSLAAGADDEFLRSIQQLTTEVGWGKVWARPGLEKKTRSFLSIAYVAPQGREHELRTHIRGALNNGATEQEIKEVLIQSAIYCGFPTALESFRIAAEVFRTVDRESI